MAGTVVIRHARPGDGEGLAQLWVDTCDYYADLAPEHFQRPRNEGLSEWFGDVTADVPEDAISLVGEADGRIVGWIWAHILEPREDAHHQLLRELAERRLVVEALIVERPSWRQGIGTRLMRAVEDGLIGSQFYVDDLPKQERNDLLLNLNFDMVGSPNFVRFVYDGDGSAFGTDGPSGSGTIEDAFNAYFASQGLETDPTEFDGRSDYDAFINAGIPAGGLTREERRSAARTGATDPSRHRERVPEPRVGEDETSGDDRRGDRPKQDV